MLLLLPLNNLGLCVYVCRAELKALFVKYLTVRIVDTGIMAVVHLNGLYIYIYIKEGEFFIILLSGNDVSVFF